MMEEDCKIFMVFYKIVNTSKVSTLELPTYIMSI